MGLYLEVDSKGEPLGTRTKANKLIADGAEEITTTPTYQKNLVCVVDNGPFEAAAFCFSRREFTAFFTSQNDGRRYRWLVATKEQMQCNFRPITLEMHAADVTGPDTFEELDQRRGP